MSSKTVVTVLCDLEHSDETTGDQTIVFGIGTAAYEVDACAAHATELRNMFAPFVDRARRASAAGTPAKRRSPQPRLVRTAPDPAPANPVIPSPFQAQQAEPVTAAPGYRTLDQRGKTAEIRAWARRRGYKVSDRGRIPTAVLDEYAAGVRA